MHVWRFFEFWPSVFYIPYHSHSLLRFTSRAVVAWGQKSKKFLTFEQLEEMFRIKNQETHALAHLLRATLEEGGKVELDRPVVSAHRHWQFGLEIIHWVGVR